MTTSKYLLAPVGQIFHDWTVLGYSHVRVRTSNERTEEVHYWLCECVCGTRRPVIASSLGMGKKVRPSRSCGCHKREVMLRDRTNVKHGLSHSGEFNSWSTMKQRCYQPQNPNYANYGGRGITVCNRWLNSFENFLADMGRQPTLSHSIDRYPDVNGNYEPNNCRWATTKEQSRNKRQTVWVEYQGKRLPLIEWCEILNIPHSRTDTRLARGWSIEDAFNIPHQRKSKSPIGGSVTNRKRMYA